jgi:hypothetical protein
MTGPGTQIAIVVTDSNPNRNTFAAIKDHLGASQDTIRLITPWGFILFADCPDAPSDAACQDGLSHSPIPGITMTLHVGKPAERMRLWAQQFGRNELN